MLFCCREKAVDEEASSTTEEDKRRSTESLPAKAFGISKSSEDCIDKSASHPNITNLPPSSQTHLGLSQAHQSLTTSDSAVSEYDSLGGSYQSLTSQQTDADSASTGGDNNQAKHQDSPPYHTHDKGGGPGGEPKDGMPKHSTTEDIEQDIDSALAEVMSGLQSLEMQQRDTITLDKPPIAHPKHTPDLVLDLPVGMDAGSPRQHSNSRGSSRGGSREESPTSTAEMFAKSDQCTIKKGSTMSQPHGPGGLRGRIYDGGMDSEGGGVMVALPNQHLGGSSMKRSTSSNVASIAARTKVILPKPERYSDPVTEVELPEARPHPQTVSTANKSRTLPIGHGRPIGHAPEEQLGLPHDRSMSLPSRQAMVARPITPDRSYLSDKAIAGSDRPQTPDRLHERSLTPERPMTPDKPQLQLKPKVYSTFHKVLPPVLPPEVPDKPKVPPKAKPPVMRKPSKSPEVFKKVQNPGVSDTQPSRSEGTPPPL